MTDTPEENPDTTSSGVEEPALTENVPPAVEWEPVVQVPYDPQESDGLTATIIAAVAEAEGVSPRDIKNPPLYEVVDTAALEAALFDPDSGTGFKQCSTEFTYRGYRIVVQAEGWVVVHEPAET